MYQEFDKLSLKIIIINLKLLKMNKIRLVSKIFAMLILLSVSIACKKTPVPVTNKLKISYEKYVMPNGLQVILSTDHSNPVISYTIMYHVGSSREVPGKTGFAHLFEHLLFGGSEDVAPGRFDKILEGVGGTNNGFTERDITTYYEIFPKNALERILWLESDRMGFFINSVTQHTLALQQNVVSNEKRQREDNTPYGYTDYVIDKYLYPPSHPYNWEVIGDMTDIRNASLADVKAYYEHFCNNPSELAGEFTITIRANEGKSLKEIEDAINEGFARFESEGITEKDIERVKASTPAM